jgi:hypothetical protein
MRVYSLASGRLVPSLVLLVAVGGCAAERESSSSSSGSCSGEHPEHGVDDRVAWKCIGPEGGRIDTSDGAWLDVPPGALDSNHTIVVRMPFPQSEFGRAYQLEPSGLEFQKSVLLTVTYPELVPGKEMPISVVQSSELQPMVSAGSEQTNWQYVEETERDPENNTLSASLNHFSSIYYYYQVDEHAYLVMDLPIKYLQAGDIVATLTNRDNTEGPDWNPGHVAVLYEMTASGSDGVVMESSPPEGVQKTSVGAFKVEFGHLYLGARRPGDPGLSLAERNGVLSFTKAQFGKPYQLVGQGNLTEGSFSCVGLVEAAYDSADRSMISWNGEFFAITPLEMFRATRPITDVYERVGQAMDIPVYGVTLDSRSPYFGTTVRGWYQKQVDYSIVATSKPPDSQFTGTPNSGFKFTWTPKVEDGCEAKSFDEPCPAAGEPHLLVLQMDATPRVTIVDGAKAALDPVRIIETLTVHVTSHSQLFEITPAPPNMTDLVVVTIPLPPDSTFKQSSLLDEATKGPISMAPFPGHTVTIVQEGYNPNAKVTVVSLHVTNTTDQVVSAAPITWRYTLDYERDRVIAPP